MGGEITILGALEKIEAGAKQRAEGCADLKHIFRQHENIQTLDHVLIRDVYDVLFRAVADEKSTYVKAKTTPVRSSAANRLSSCAGTLRATVDATLWFIGLKTTRLTVDHLLQTLVLADGKFCEPLALDYAKCLASVLRYQPHVEHFDQHDRDHIVTFCLACIRRAVSEVQDDVADIDDDNAHVSGTSNGLSCRSSRSYNKHLASSQNDLSMPKQVAEELVACLALLTQPSNATQGLRAADMLWTFLDFLKASSFPRRAHHQAFVAINHILARTRTEEIQLTRSAACHLVRLIRMFWPVKTTAETSLLKDELLATWTYIRPYLPTVAAQEERVLLRSELHDAFATMRDEYSQSEQRHLRFEDIRFEFGDRALRGIKRVRTSLMSLRCGDARAETAWIQLYTMASVNVALVDMSRAAELSDNGDHDTDFRPQKRQRLNNDLDELLSSSAMGAVSCRVTALQILLFLGQIWPCSAEQLGIIISKLSLSCSDQNLVLSAWAYAALASFASQSCSTSTSVSASWLTSWQMANRAIGNKYTCRVACLLLHIMLETDLVPQQSKTDLAHMLTSSMQLHGPAILADSVAALLCYTVEAARRTNVASMSSLAESTVSWLFGAFTPSKLDDRSYTAQQLSFEAFDVLTLLFSCLGQPCSDVGFDEYPVWNMVSRVWLACQEQEELMAYLLLLPDQQSAQHQNLEINRIGQNAPSTSVLTCEMLVLNQLISELSRSHDRWKESSSRSISPDVLVLFVKTCHVATYLAFGGKFQDTQKHRQLREQTIVLLDSLSDFVRGPNCSNDKVDIFLATFSRACSMTADESTPDVHSSPERVICRTIARTMLARQVDQTSHEADQEDDFVSLDARFDSQDYRKAGKGGELEGFSKDDSALINPMALRSNIVLYTKIVSWQDEMEEAKYFRPTSTKVTEYVLALPAHAMLSSHYVLSRLTTYGVDLMSADIETLIVHCEEVILPDYRFERSEAALGSILSVMDSLIHGWTDTTNGALLSEGMNVYEWFTGKVLASGILGPRVQKRLANLLLRLCHMDTDYGRSSDLPSVRTSLFSLLKIGSIDVQYHLSSRVTSIFNLYVLPRHEEIFQDILTSLPEDPDWVEGMAMRLLFLSRLASAWHTLLRHCIYYIYETAGRTKYSTSHATWCTADLARSLKYNSPQRLFSLFAPQLFHTWFENQNTIANLPFAVFKYRSLDDLFRQNESELFAQLLLQGDTDGMRLISKTLQTSETILATRCFAKCIAYCISWDISKPPAQGTASAESRLRALVGGKDAMKALLTENFAAAIGTLFLSLQEGDNPVKWLEKKDSTAFKAFKEITGFSQSEQKLPENQQPSFKGRYICDQIERLQRRVTDDKIKAWSPSSFGLVARMLIDSIDDALGPLHTCAIVRRLRLLVCIAGVDVLSGFALELLIHTLRPLLSDSQCAEDVMGLLRYLFHQGRHHLEMNASFTAGATTSMVLQMKSYAISRQDSTTQESQYKATVYKMKEFHVWLVQFLGECQHSGCRVGSSMRSLAKALEDVELPISACKETSGSVLLLLLLRNGGKEEPMFTNSDWEEILAMFSRDFEIPDMADDCLMQDQDCAEFSGTLWTITKNAHFSKTFSAWAARALGRAYASNGLQPRDSEIAHIPSGNDSSLAQGVARSLAKIAQQLSASLFSKDRRHARLADFTLRRTVTTFKDPEDAIAFAQMLPPAVVSAIELGTCGYLPFEAVLHEIDSASPMPTLAALLEPSSASSVGIWAQTIASRLCHDAQDIAVLPALAVATSCNETLSLDLLPCIIHVVLAHELDKESTLRRQLSACVAAHLSELAEAFRAKQRYMLDLLLFLRAQAWPNEATKADRLRWLDIDWTSAAYAAMRCGMAPTALLFVEHGANVAQSIRRTSARSSTSQSVSQVTLTQAPQDLLMNVFRTIDEPDSFYGIPQPATLSSVLGRLDHERDGFRSLMFRSAQNDTDFQQNNNLSRIDTQGLVRSLSVLNLNSLIFALLSNASDTTGMPDDLLRSARKLQQWDSIAIEGSSLALSTSFSALKELSRARDRSHIRERLHSLLVDHIRPVRDASSGEYCTKEWLSALTSLVEVGEVVDSTTIGSIHEVWRRMQSRQSWMPVARFEDAEAIISNRQAIFSILLQNRPLLTRLRIEYRDCRVLEVEALLQAGALARKHSRLQDALVAVNQSNDLARRCKDEGIQVEAAVGVETASVLWDAGEGTVSVQILQDTLRSVDLEHQDVAVVGRPGLMAQIAHHLADARLEKPDQILSKYLKPAITYLKEKSFVDEAGQVHHEFATFCDKQLQNTGNIEDLERITKLRQRKLEEVEDLEKLAEDAKKAGRDKHEYTKDYSKARQWFDIDDMEYQRLKRNRDTYVQQSLQNYLLALRTSEAYNMSVLRFFALWLENSDMTAATLLVSKVLPGVASWKFVVLMNQLVSRLERENSSFQTSLTALVLRICSEHPHHSLHQLFATTRKPASKEQAVITRWEAAAEVRSHLHRNPQKSDLLRRVFQANNIYNVVALERTDDMQSSHPDIASLPATYKMIKDIPGLHVAPATMDWPLRADLQYADVPVITQFSRKMRLMSGLSRPKKITAIASNGKQYTQLFKSGNDDLRQDAIMEQVFEEVSKMLQNHKATRHRNLNVRTYKVIPLTPRSGIIEFVPHSTSFTEFLVPAHERYYPQDMKERVARGKISAVKDHSTETRLREYRKVCDRLHPVLRYFFFERYNDPTEWFEKRTAYTRTTATISMLGHVLGLGDRHCQNIMLDDKTGEVVHIDLGVAFEAGRVLPVPELVPFRLTRDVIDGMGITKIEGVFRRCCEFTLDALREDRDNIMTLLNVLRYDPLYTWTISPLRAKRIQEDNARENVGHDITEGSSKKREQEAGEADRALSIVEKKLSKTLSTAAAVNELIQQATDERNLATLFSGWSAYF